VERNKLCSTSPKGPLMSVLTDSSAAKARRASSLPTLVTEGRALWLLLAAGASALLWYGRLLTSAQQLLLWALVLAAAAGLSLAVRLRLFGPVLFYDLIRTARRQQVILLRFIYAALLFYILFFVYLIWLARFATFENGFWATLLGYSLSTRQAAGFAAVFFALFMGTQLLTVFLLVPAYTSGAIAAEKERGTLTLMLATDLRSPEIVLSILGARLANMVLFLLAGLPMLSLMEFMGGIDPELVLAGFAATALTVLSLGAWGLLNSVRSPKPRTALFRSYLWIVLYLTISAVSAFLVSVLGLGAFPTTDDWISPVTLQDVVDWFNAGNVLFGAKELFNRVGGGTPLKVVLHEVLRPYAVFHGLVTVVCVIWAVTQLRACTLVDDTGRRPPTSKRCRRDLPHRRVWVPRACLAGWPLLWKEMITDSGPRRSWLTRLGIGVLIAAVFFPPVLLIEWVGGLPGEGLKQPMNLWACAMTGLIGSLMLVQVAVRAAGSVTSERTGHTLEGLLTTPLDLNEILFAKWLASVLGSRWLALLLALVWLAALVTGGMSPVAALVLALAWLVYAAAMAGLGLYCSVASRTTPWATFASILGMAFLVLATFLLAVNLIDPHDQSTAPFALTPPFALSRLEFFSEAAKPTVESVRRLWAYAGAGLLLWSAIAISLWFVAAIRFRIAVGRPRSRRAEQPAVVNSAIETPATPAHAMVAAAIGPSTPPSGPGVSQDMPDPQNAGPSNSATAQLGRARSSKRRWSRPGADDDVPPLARRSLRSRVGAGVLVLLPFLLMLAWQLYLAFAGKKHLQDAIAEADRLDPGWRLEEMLAKRRPIPPERNSAPHVVAAAALLSKGHSDPQRQAALHEALVGVFRGEEPPEVLLDENQARTLTKALADDQPALREARRIAEMPEGSFPANWDGPGQYFRSRFAHVGDAGMVADLLSYDVLLALYRADMQGAMHSCQALVNVAHSIADEPEFWPIIEHANRRGMIARRIEQILAQGAPAESDLARMQELLEEELKADLYLFMARAGRAMNDLPLQGLQEGKARFEHVVGWVGYMHFSEWLRLALGGSLSDQRAALLRHNTRVVEIAKMPPHTQFGLLRTLDQARYKLPPLALSISWHFLNLSHWDSLAELRCAVVMLAMERYRLALQRWPESLEALVPGFLREIPADPFDGKPLRYRRQGGGVVIYSVGFNGVDNGGNIVRKPPSKASAIGSDVGVRLYDTSRRRQPPPRGSVGPPKPPYKLR
jgi:ABC-type transport system involved in multi-copper enzyme maturation permease subunit